jgi:hypothetical protein
MNQIKEIFDKYYYYRISVQEPEADIEFINNVYKELKSTSSLPTTLREDFCGTFSLCCEWVKLNHQNKAYGVDLDSEPIEYGMQQYYPQIPAAQKTNLAVLKEDVLTCKTDAVQILCALNFSYFIFKERQILKKYFHSALSNLSDDGLFIMDCFGGSECYGASEEETEDDENKYSYFWDQENFDPVTNEATFHIHFKKYGEQKREKLFTYNWRMWSLPEIKDLLKEVGFKKVHIFWEGSDDDGDGDGCFKRVTKGEDCESWIAYIVAEK